MPITDLSRKMKRFREANKEARETGVPVDEIFGRNEEAYERSLATSLEKSHEKEGERSELLGILDEDMDRRSFLKRSAMVGAAAAGATTFLSTGSRIPQANAATAPRVVVVGAGFAGLSAAYRINQLTGWAPAVYEAQARVGGRARTIRTGSGGQFFEAGASGISSNETILLNLLTELGLAPLTDLWLNYPTRTGGELYHFLGNKVYWSDIKAGVTAVSDASWTAWGKINKVIPSYKSANAYAKTKDAQTAAAFIDAATSNAKSRAYQKQIIAAEYGGLATDTSALHTILEEGNFWGAESGYDERWAVPGGNDTLSTTLAARLPAGSINYGQALTAIKKNTDNTYTLTFSSGGVLTQVVADRVVLAIPPTLMRTVDYSAAGFSAAKGLAIQNEKMGTNTKHNIQFSGQPWSANSKSGDSYSDMVTGSTWQCSYQGTNPAWLVLFNNKNYGASLPAHGLAPASVVTESMTAIDKLWAGISSKAISGQYYVDNWPQDPWVKGSYSYHGVNGFTTFGGAAEEREGNVHFAGEHTAPYTKRGTMDGAVESGERVATELTSY